MANTFRIRSTGYAGQKGSKCERRRKDGHRDVRRERLPRVRLLHELRNERPGAVRSRKPKRSRTNAAASTTRNGRKRTKTAKKRRSTSSPATQSKARCTPTTPPSSAAGRSSAAKATNRKTRSKSTAAPTARASGCKSSATYYTADRLLHDNRPDSDAASDRHVARILRRRSQPSLRRDAPRTQRQRNRGHPERLEQRHEKMVRIQKNGPLARERPALRAAERRSGLRTHEFERRKLRHPTENSKKRGAAPTSTCTASTKNR